MLQELGYGGKVVEEKQPRAFTPRGYPLLKRQFDRGKARSLARGNVTVIAP